MNLRNVRNFLLLIAFLGFFLVALQDKHFITASKYLRADPIQDQWHHRILEAKDLKQLHITPSKLLETAKYINTKPSYIVFAAGYENAANKKHGERLRKHLEWWLTIEEVKSLAKHINSKIPCVRIYGAAVSDCQNGYSTEGVEAARLIYGYIKPGAYPAQFWDGGIYPDNTTAPLILQVKQWLEENHIDTNP